MKAKYLLGILFWLAVVVISGALLYFYADRIAMLNPKGWVAEQQRDLMWIATWLMLLVVIPVFIMTGWISWKYRASNKKAKYTPDWDNSYLAEAVWWGFPFAIIIILSVVTFKSSHALDPYKPLISDKPPLRVQVVALQWKWLFIYPEQQIASVNLLQIPEKTPISFEITADAPMNSFWIPELGGQIYAMSGMRTRLHLIADHPGEYAGSSANLSGVGFSGMRFVTRASSQNEFEEWVKKAQGSGDGLDEKSYAQLAIPSEYNPVATFTLKDPKLFETILMKTMNMD